jgi:predicted permease
MEVYDPQRWTDFFILVGTGSATLAGLVFVAMTINSRVLNADATHKYRAINMLSGFTAVFVLSALALMGQQTYRWLGVEWLVVATLATAINTNGYLQAYRVRSSRYALGSMRILGGSACYLGQIGGAVMICLGEKSGIYLAATALIVNFCFFVSGAWLLIVGTLRESDEGPESA